MTTYANGSLERGAAIVECVGNANDPLTLTEIASATGLSRPTAFRLLAVLCRLGFVHKDKDSGTYSLGYKVYGIGRSSRRYESIARDSRPILRRLAYDLGQTTFLVVLQGAQAVCYDKVEPPEGLRLHTSIGMRVDAHATSTGKVLLAGRPLEEVRQIYRAHPLYRHTDRTITSLAGLLSELRAIREQGYAVDRGELLPGIESLAVAVETTIGTPFMAISVTGPVHTLAGRTLRGKVDRLHRAQREIFEYRVRSDAA